MRYVITLLLAIALQTSSIAATPAIIQTDTDELSTASPIVLSLTGVTAGNYLVVVQNITTTDTPENTIEVSDNVETPSDWPNIDTRYDATLLIHVTLGYRQAVTGGNYTVTIDKNDLSTEGIIAALFEVENVSEVAHTFNFEVNTSNSLTHNLWDPAVTIPADSIAFAGVSRAGTGTLTATGWTDVDAETFPSSDIITRVFATEEASFAGSLSNSISRPWLSGALVLKDAGGSSPANYYYQQNQ